LEQFRREFDVLFDRFFSDWPAPFEPEAAGVRMWDFDVSDSDNEVIVKAELPGFDDKDLDVQVNDNLLTIKAEKQRKGDGEREYRSFRRTITLPAGTNPDKAQASYHNGVLELHLPKTEQAKGKRIPVEAKAAGTAAPAGEKEPAKQGRPK